MDENLQYEKLIQELSVLGNRPTPKTLTRKIIKMTVELLAELDQIDETTWILIGEEPLPAELIPMSNRWFTAVGETDSNGNFKLPAEFLTENKIEIERVKAQRKLLRKIKALNIHHYQIDQKIGETPLEKSNRLRLEKFNHETEVHRTKEEQEQLIDNVKWAKRFDLNIQQIAYVLGETKQHLYKLAPRLS